MKGIKVRMLTLTVLAIAASCSDNQSRTDANASTNTDSPSISNARKVPLDLSLPTDNTEVEINLNHTNQLPQFFGDEANPKNKKVEVGAKLLSDESKEKTYVEAVKGAEIKIEIQTN